MSLTSTTTGRGERPVRAEFSNDGSAVRGSTAWYVATKEVQKGNIYISVLRSVKKKMGP